MNPEARLTHYGYTVSETKYPWGRRWTFSPCTTLRDFASKAEAIAAATHVLDADLDRCERMVALTRTIARRVAG